MTVPYDGEYLRDLPMPPYYRVPTGAEAVDVSWADAGKALQINAEPRSGAGEGTDKGEAAGEALEPRWAETGARVIAGEPVPRASDINALIEERDRLREAVKRVRELHRGDMTCDACGFLMPCPTIQPLGEEA